MSCHRVSHWHILHVRISIFLIIHLALPPLNPFLCGRFLALSLSLIFNSGCTANAQEADDDEDCHDIDDAHYGGGLDFIS